MGTQFGSGVQNTGTVDSQSGVPSENRARNDVSPSALAASSPREGGMSISLKSPGIQRPLESSAPEQRDASDTDTFSRLPSNKTTLISLLRSIVRWFNGEKQLEDRGFSPELIDATKQRVSFPKHLYRAEHADLLARETSAPTLQLSGTKLRKQLLENGFSPIGFMKLVLQDEGVHPTVLDSLRDSDFLNNGLIDGTIKSLQEVRDVVREKVSEALLEKFGSVDPLKLTVATSLGYSAETISKLETAAAGSRGDSVLQSCRDLGISSDAAILLLDGAVELSTENMQGLRDRDVPSVKSLMQRRYQLQDVLRMDPNAIDYCLRKRVPPEVAWDCVNYGLELNDTVVERLKAGTHLRENGYSPQLIAFMPLKPTGPAPEYVQDIETCTYKRSPNPNKEYERRVDVRNINEFWNNAEKSKQNFVENKRELPASHPGRSFLDELYLDVLDRNLPLLESLGYLESDRRDFLIGIDTCDLIQIVEQKIPYDNT